MLKLKLLTFLCAISFFSFATPEEEAMQVIQRYAGNQTIPVKLKADLKKTETGCDRFSYIVENGILNIRGSSGVALCRGFYDYVKSNKAGIFSWSGKRLELPSTLEEQPQAKNVTSPFPHHYYFNVVTYGYTMPYWTWKRWEQEIDWMALHGIDMPLALVANEAISARVWKKLGLTDQEIAEYFVGPAHFPWMRMGNISGLDSPLPLSWHDDQIALQHKILKRMKALGMKPICPGFAGFVPQAMQRLFPDIKLVQTSWCGGAFHNWMLSPDLPLFKKIGQMFIEEWEKEFGPNDYYIVDSFNEMEIPFPPKGKPERYNLLASYGEAVYGAIKAGNPNATWVMQGWMFGYQRYIWDFDTLAALLKNVPDDKMILLDLAVDYNKHFWHNGNNWDLHKGFHNKGWVYSVIPNMGGKSGLTGVLDFYANGHLEALNSANRGKLVGHGMAPEGIENNEVVYEMICDAGWRDQKIDTKQWLNDYNLCRYGKTAPQLDKYWDGMLQSVYGSFTDHPRYNWQFRAGGTTRKGSINSNDNFFAAIESMAETIPLMKDSPLFTVDMIEMTAHYLGAKMEILIQAINQAFMNGEKDVAEEFIAEFNFLGLHADYILSQHPTLRLDRWINFARTHGETTELKNYYERNARRIVTIWGPPVDDYSARIWGGLIRDYYLPRWNHYFESKRSGKPFNFAAWERQWVEQTTGLTRSCIVQDITTIQLCANLIERAKKITPAILTASERNTEQLATWSPTDVTTTWKEVSWDFPVDKLKQLKGIRFQYIRGNNKLMIKKVVLEMDGVDVCTAEHYGETGTNNSNNTYLLAVPEGATGNNSCRIRATIQSDGTHDSYGKILILLNK